MIRLKSLLFTIPISLFCLLGLAQSNNDHDPKAKDILDKVSAKTKTYTTIKVEFTMVMQGKDKSKKPETQKGALQLKGDNYKLDIKGQEIISDGKTSWTYLKDNNELQINSVDPGADDAVTPSSIFTIYEKGYKYKFDSETARTQSINLFPLNPDKKKFHTLKLVIDKEKKQIISFAVFMKDGNVFEYTINSFKSNTDIPDTVFQFNEKAHPGIEVVDLRD